MKIIKTICGMCGGDYCGIDVYVEGDKIVNIKGMQEHPHNRGWLCPQARAAIELEDGLFHATDLCLLS